MTSETILVNEKSNIPLSGVDFLGIIDRGTNIIELKPVTLCNLKCKYCFVSAGDYSTNFIIEPDYLIQKVKELIDIKGRHDIEIHIAPYGEILLYQEIYNLIKMLWKIEGIKIISMQSNGLLLTENKIQKLSDVKLTRLNISLNTLNRELAEFLCNCESYDIDGLINNIKLLLKTNINVLLAPVWFPGENDSDIEDVIKLVLKLRSKGTSDKKVQIGIQKYLIYKTGRKLKKIRPKTWGYFYKQLTNLEKKYSIKLKLGPQDFGIHKREIANTFNLKKNDIINAKIISQGRWENECIAKLNNDFGIKILLNKPLRYSNTLIGKKIQVKVIKANYKDNIITAIFPI